VRRSGAEDAARREGRRERREGGQHGQAVGSEGIIPKQEAPDTGSKQSSGGDGDQSVSAGLKCWVVRVRARVGGWVGGVACARVRVGGWGLGRVWGGWAGGWGAGREGMGGRGGGGGSEGLSSTAWSALVRT
jgi:hypothetical protein